MVTGKLEAISEKLTKTGKKRYGYLVDSVWYNSFRQFKVVKGQTVDVTFESTSYGNAASNIVEHKEDYSEPEAKSKIIPATTPLIPIQEQQEQEKRLRLLEIASRLFNIDNPKQAIEKAEQMRRYVETGRVD